MKIKKPSIVILDDLSYFDKFNIIKNKKIYKSKYDLETKEERDELKKNISLWEEFYNYMESNSFNEIGYTKDYKGNKLNSIYLKDVVDYSTLERERYTNTRSFTQVVETTRRYNIYKGIKKYRLKGNHLLDWYSQDAVDENFNNTEVSQYLDDAEYIKLLKDDKTSVIVSYGYKESIQRMELKNIYCSTKGRYITYKGKRYYIKE